MTSFTAILALAALAEQRSPAIVTPYWRKDPLAIRDVRLPSPTVPQYSVAEMRVDLGATYDNPFDPQDVSLEATVVPPSGKPFVVPGFLYRPYERELKDGVETLRHTGEPEWRLRVSPMEVGEHKVTVRVTDRTGSTEHPPMTLNATAATAPGFVRISPRDHRYFQFDNGKPYFPIGANVAWAGPRGTFDYDDWFPKYGAAGANYARIWQSPENFTFALERTGKPEEGKGMGQFDLGNAWRLDQVLEKAQANNLYLMLCIDSYNVLRNHDAHNAWERSPHNRDNGGPLRIWTDFWTSQQMDRLYRAKLRYLVARYGANPSVFAWEFWNEVDLTRDFDMSKVQAWHSRMGQELRQIDPYDHLITTSFGDMRGQREIDLLPELDIVQTHHYNSPDIVGTIAFQQSRKASWGKPHFVGEIGADSNGPRAEDDPEGLQVHDPMWVSIATGGSGAAMAWWWDSLIEPKNLYPLYTAVSRFTADIDWPAEGFRQTTATLAYQTAPKGLSYRDLEISGGPMTWEPSEVNRPRIIRVSGGKASGLPLAGLLHGMRNHPNLVNPVQFKVDLPRKTRFEVQVDGVSGHGGAGLRITLDDDRILTRDFADPDGTTNTATITKYNGTYGFDVPPGKHTIVVRNPGNDWVMASYRFVKLVPQKGPPLDAWAITGDRTAIAWLRVKGRTWSRVAGQKQRVMPAPPSVIGLKGLRSGQWKVELWDTWRGVPMQTRTAVVRNNGVIRLALPTISRDLAVKLRHQ